MNLKDRIIELTTEIKELEDKADAIHIEANTLREAKEKLIVKMLLESKILEDTSWDVGSYVGGVRLDYIKSYGSNVFDVFESLSDLAGRGTDVWMEIVDGVSLRFEDGESTLTFKEAKQVMPFIKKNKMKLTGGTITDRLAKMKRDTAALESICHTFNLWNKKT
jgi:hypothetical protein